MSLYRASSGSMSGIAGNRATYRMSGMKNRTKGFLLEELTTFTLNHSNSSQGWVSLYTKKDTPKGSDISPRVGQESHPFQRKRVKVLFPVK